MIVLLMLSAAAGTPFQPATMKAPSSAKTCLVSSKLTATNKKAPLVHPLAEEPNAKLLAAVYYSENGCPKPIVIREDIGQH